MREWLQRLRRKLATLGVGLLAGILATHVVFGANGIAAYQQKREQARVLEEEIHRLEEENRRLSEHIRDLKTNPEAIEKEAREQLRYARPGEVIFVLDAPAAPAPDEAARARR